MQVEVVAQSGPAVGTAIFEARGYPLPAAVAHNDDAPTAERVAGLITNADLFMFSGHGTGQSNLGGTLLLADSHGNAVPFSVLDALAGPPMPSGAGVVLSACETAWDIDSPAPAASSIASAFLELGAEFVLAGMWRVSDLYAARLTAQFCELIADGTDPARALATCLKTLIESGVPRSRWSAFCLLTARES